MIREHADVVVLGAGFSGSLMATVLRRLGRSVILVERGSHPRFALGESSTPLANLALEELARDHDLPWLADLAKYGRWKKTYPDLTCGLKRGFTFVAHRPGQPFVPAPDHANELLVAASPADEVADTHWLRLDIDQFLARKAEEAGAIYLDRARLEIEPHHPYPWRLAGWCGDDWAEITTCFLVDATGPGAALPRALSIDMDPVGMRTYSWSIYSHFTGVAKWEQILEELGGRTDEHPFHCDDAALHHLLDEGWIWVLPFDNGVTSAGILIEGWRQQPDRTLTPEQEWQVLLSRYPGVARQFSQAKAIRPFERTGRLQRRARGMVGPTWALLAPTAYTLDALYSTGNAHALHSVQQLARLIERHWEGDLPEALLGYQEALDREIALLDLLVDGAYQSLRSFGLLTSYAMYYFAGAIAAEERRRQGRAAPDEGFLSSHDAAYRDVVERGYRRVSELAHEERPDVEAFAREVARDIGPWNTTGLCDAGKRNLYPYG